MGAVAHLHFQNASQIIIGHTEPLRLLEGCGGRGDAGCPSCLATSGSPQLQLDAHGVALHRLLHAIGLPQSIAQVVVSLREVGLPGDGFLVRLDCLIQEPLLIVHACKMQSHNHCKLQKDPE